MEFVDTHCHIHSADYELDPDRVIEAARAVDVNKLICVGTSLDDSIRAIEFVRSRPSTWASIGLHPHDSKDYVAGKSSFEEFEALATKPKVMAVGECGLDFYYNHSPKKDQFKILELQISLAKKHDLPLIFHVRDAFDEFWPIFDNFKGLRGVIHSFTANMEVLDQILSRGLYVGLNGIVTFSKSADQNYAALQVPLNRLVLETDAPYLTPVPERGKVCEPKHLRLTAEFLASHRGIPLQELADTSTKNAIELFNLN